MASEIKTDTIIRTKLHRPSAPRHYVHRPRLLEALDIGRDRPLTLVSAPAGYGKSVLTSCWLETCDRPCAWLSLDERDNDLHQFMCYFIAAIQTVFPAVGTGALSLLNAPELPPLNVLAHELINEMDDLDQDFILVLDDIHRINEESVNELIASLLNHPPRSMHLIMLGRQDPVLPLSSIRALGLVTEIRIHDLRFTLAETTEYLRLVLGEQVDGPTAAALAKKSEGWVTGLHLAVLAMRSYNPTDNMLVELKGTTPYVTDYLISEVLSQQPPTIRRYLLNTSILNRFNAELCHLLSNPDMGTDEAKIDGRAFIKRIQEFGLFVIPLDLENCWFRYHHLFQQLLHDQLNLKRTDSEIAFLHHRAAVWFAENGFIGEALHHFLAGRFTDDAGMMVARQGHSLIDRERVVELEGWLRQLSRDVIARNPLLLLFEVWIARFNRQISVMAETLDKVELLLQDNPPSEDLSDLIYSCIYAMRSYERYCMLDPTEAQQMAKQAIALAPPDHLYMRGFAMIILAVSLQMTGRYLEALSVMNTALTDSSFQQSHFQALLLAGLSPCCLMEVDLPTLRRTAVRLLHLGTETGLPPYRAWGRFYLACSHYQCNEVEKAARILADHFEDRYLMYPHTAGDGAVVLAFSLHVLGQSNKARQVADLLTNHAIESGNAGLLRVEQALQAELALRQGRLAEAIAWARTFQPIAMQAHYFFYLPELTLAKILVAENSPESLKRAKDLLLELEQFSRNTHNLSILIPILALQALLLDLATDRVAAFSKATESVALAESSGGLRLLLDLGPPITDLLKRLRHQKTSVEFIETLLAAFENEAQRSIRHEAEGFQLSKVSSADKPLIEPLTNRELDVLELLFQRLQNKEIAAKLFISSKTVKKHLEHIYRKLDACNRRQCLEKATQFGIVFRR